MLLPAASGPLTARRCDDPTRMIDPLERWREYGEKPDYAGLLSFSGVPYTGESEPHQPPVDGLPRTASRR